MRVSRIDHGLDNHLIVESDEPRAQGLHASDLYGALYRRLNPKRFRAEPPNPLLLALGLAWERYFQGVVEAAGLDITRPPSFMSPEGVWLSPDGLLFNGHSKIIELKLTHKAPAETLDDSRFAHWLTQVKAYGHVLGINRVRFYVLFDSWNPQLRAYDLEFTADEMKDEWQALLNIGKAEGLL